VTSTAHSTHIPALEEPHQGAEVARQLVDSWREPTETVAERARERVDRLSDLDAASQDAVIEVLRALERQLWMIRAQFVEEGRH